MNTPLLPLPVNRESVTPGQLYIWHVEGRRMRVVGALPHGLGLETLDDGGYWSFSHALIGCLYGPIALVENL